MQQDTDRLLMDDIVACQVIEISEDESNSPDSQSSVEPHQVKDICSQGCHMTIKDEQWTQSLKAPRSTKPRPLGHLKPMLTGDVRQFQAQGVQAQPLLTSIPDRGTKRPRIAPPAESLSPGERVEVMLVDHEEGEKEDPPPGI
ncbi:hypothetical protein AMTR_s00035p00171640 [Amborella trichopoda]|uniref:Uncharacterized protein n=1 Tax=Amborella trichopoda TaxID=13333 RepID=W1PXC1_AMBTC|nr:hypothetical protein AMTR_s00035p00171640 [Amborella trichopoda]